MTSPRAPVSVSPSTVSLRSVNLLGALAALVAACGVAPGPSEARVPLIRAFSASESEVAAGSWVRLSWLTEGVGEVTLTDSRGAPVPSVGAPAGTVQVWIDADETFILRARAPSGVTQSASLAVRVRRDADGAGVLFGVSPSVIEPGEVASLVWRAPPGTELTLSAEPPGAASELPSRLEPEGSLPVSPLEDTRYRLQGRGWTRSLVVDVSPGALELAAEPASAAPGGAVAIRWRVAGARSLELWSPERGRLHFEEGLSGVAEGRFVDRVPADVDRSRFLAYELRLADGERQRVRSLGVPVEGRPRVLRFEVPALGRFGRTVILRWLTEDADSVELEANGRPVPLVDPSGPDAGTPSLDAAGEGRERWRTLELPTPPVPTVFRLTVRHARGGHAVEERRLDVVGPPTLDVAVRPGVVRGGELARLSWAGSSVRTLVVEAPDEGVVYRADGGALDVGAASVRPNRDTRYVVEAGNGLGEVVRGEVQVAVERPVRPVPAAVGALRAGQRVELSWDLDGGAIVGFPHGVVDVRDDSTGFVDIGPTATRVPFGQRSAVLETDFRGHLFGQAVGEHVRVSALGYLSFSSRLNDGNDDGVPLPSATMEPLSVVPLWADSRPAPAEMMWLVRDASAGGVLGRQLVVQWNFQDTLGSTVQAMVHESGQVDFEYGIVDPDRRAYAGVQGPHPRWGHAAPVAPRSATGLTFFGPRRSPLSVTPEVEGRWSGLVPLDDGGPPLRLEHVFDRVVRKNDLFVSEVLASPGDAHRAVGAAPWVELSNALAVPLSLAGWTLALPGGRVLALTGTLPARGTALVSSAPVAAVGGSEVETWLDEGFALDPDGGTLVLGREGPLGVFDYSRAEPGASEVNDVGPFRSNLAGESVGGRVGRPEVCRRSAPGGAPEPRDAGAAPGPSPGIGDGCGFGYGLARIEPDFTDISDAGAVLMDGVFDSVVRELDLSASPFPFFRAPRRSARVSANGFVSFAERINSYDHLNTTRPSPSDANLLVAAFADDLAGRSSPPQSSVRWARFPGVAGGAGLWIIQWSHVTHSGTSDDLSFQIKLFDDGVIEVHFGEMWSSTSACFGAGYGANTWLENEGGTRALVVNANSVDPGVAANSAYRFTPLGALRGG